MNPPRTKMTRSANAPTVLATVRVLPIEAMKRNKESDI